MKDLSRWEGELNLHLKIKGSLKKEKQMHKKLKSSGDCLGNEWYPVERLDEIKELLIK